MEDVRRWSVTYTKHVKQKRKVYQDGILELDSSGHKVMLYDDSEKLLDSRFMKLDDTVKAGGTITFGAFLVDIGDPDGDSNTIPTSSFQERDVKIADRGGSLHGNKLKTNSTSIGNKKSTSGMHEAISSNLSPSQKIIKEFKKTEVKKYGASASCPDTTKANTTARDVKIADRGGLLHGNKLNTNSTSIGNKKSTSGMHEAISSNLSPSQKIIIEFKKTEVKKYGASASCPDTTKANTTEWQVLYTTQITKKSKTYHDGTLKLVIYGLQGRQVMLYDASGRLLDSRFLKKDEMVTSGESLTFDGHLVDIGECDGDHKPRTDLNVQGGNCKKIRLAGVEHGEQSHTCHKFPVEWDAMYTTQTTQKTKKYHDGVIRLASYGSSRMQATLLTEDGTILSRRFLNLSEDMGSGSTFQLPNYLVEIGQPRKNHEGEHNETSVSNDKDVKVGGSDMYNIKLSSRVPDNRPLREPQDASPFQNTKVRSSGADKVLSAGEVLINKPLRNANAILSSLKKPNTGEGSTNVKGESVDQCHASQSSGFVHSDIQNQEQGQSVESSCGKRIKIEDHHEGTFTIHNFSGEASNSKPIHVGHSIETIVSDFDSREHGMHPLVPGALSLDSNGPLRTAPEPYDGSKENEETGDLTEAISSNATSNFSFNHPTEEVKDDESHQEPSGDNMETNSTSCDGAPSCNRTSSTDFVLPDHGDIERKTSPTQKITITDECPGFDLGF